MARRHVKLGWIVDDEARKAVYKRRVAGLMKKLEELNILCDAPSFMIAYCPGEKEPTVYPSHAEAKKLIKQYMGVPDQERSEEKVSHEGYLKEMLAEVQELVAERQKGNMELEAYHLVTQIRRGVKRIADLTKEEVAKILWFMREIMDVIGRRQMLMEGGNGGIGTSGGGPVEKPAGDGSD